MKNNHNGWAIQNNWEMDNDDVDVAWGLASIFQAILTMIIFGPEPYELLTTAIMGMKTWF